MSSFQNSGQKSWPVFAVVGRVNEGKSSIIATLVENDGVRIGPEPGTTRSCQSFRMEVGGQTLFEVIDTPGFQEPEAMLAWLKERDRGATSRPKAIEEFVATFKDSGRFQDECELLKPILNGAYIVYVADASHPFRPSYEAEIEILRWTGLPRMALLNRSAGHSTVFEAEWTRALSQYFNIIRAFDAHHAHIDERLQLLRSLQALSDEIRSALTRAVTVLERLNGDRLKQAARSIAGLLVDAVTLTHTYPLPTEMRTGEAISEEKRRELGLSYNQDFSERERQTRLVVERLYNYRKLESREQNLAPELFEADLFSDNTWQFLGLSRAQLMAAGTLTGAATGGVIDAAVGGHSFMLGTLLGSIAGLASTAFLSVKAPTHKVVGMEICGPQIVVGPIDLAKAPNFPWVVLDRALLHYQALMARTHAVQGPMTLISESGVGPVGVVNRLDTRLRTKLAGLFRKLSKGRGGEAAREQLIDLIMGLLRSA